LSLSGVKKRGGYREYPPAFGQRMTQSMQADALPAQAANRARLLSRNMLSPPDGGR